VPPSVAEVVLVDLAWLAARLRDQLAERNLSLVPHLQAEIRVIGRWWAVPLAFDVEPVQVAVVGCSRGEDGKQQRSILDPLDAVGLARRQAKELPRFQSLSLSQGS
jgi:hypothetical protein